MKAKTFALLFLFLLLSACCPEQLDAIPYTDLLEQYQISVEDQQGLAAFSYSVLDGYFGEDVELSDLSSSAFQDFEYKKLFISYIHEGKLRCSQGGSSISEGSRIYFDLIEANTDCIEDDGFGGVLTGEEVQDVEIIFDFMLNRTKLNYKDLADLEAAIEPGIHAVELEAAGRVAYFVESVPISHNYSVEQMLERLCLKAGQDETCYLEPGTEIYLYDTFVFKANRQNEITHLYRYNIFIDADSITADTLLESLQDAEQWFSNNIDPQTGMLEYIYYPSDDAYSTDNNHVRQLACLWAMSELQAFLGSSTFDEVITTSLDYYLQYMTDGGYLSIDGDAKLAYSAFPILALLGTQYPNRDQIMQDLADGILALQNDDGSYDTHFESDNNSGQDFYPGEAMLALMKFYNYTGEEKYLQSVQKAFPYYREYWRSNKNTAFIPWHSQAYLLLYQATGDPELAEFVFEMSDWMIGKYQVVKTDYPDTLGGFYRSPGNSTASYMEGVNDAYRLAVLTGDEERQAEYAKSIRYAVRFILQMQYTPENVFYLENPTRAIGGFRQSLLRNEQRNDYTQHASFALIKTYNNEIFD